MFNGYLFAMFQNQQKQSAGRDSLRREERSLEGGRGFGRGGGIGGASFGGAGGGRGMINVTPGGAGGGRSGAPSGAGIGLGGGLFSAGTSLLTSEGRKGIPIAKSFGAATGISNALGMGTVSKGGVYSSDVLRAAGRASKGFNPAKVSVKIAELIGDPSTTSVFAKLLKGGDQAVDTAEAVAKGAGAVTATRTGVQQLDFMLDMTAAGKGDLASEMLDATARAEGIKTGRIKDAEFDADIFNALTDRKGKKLFNRKQVEIFKELGLSPGVANYDRYVQRIASAKTLRGLRPLRMRSAGESAQGLAESIKKYYPGTSFKNLEEAVVLTEFARKIEQGVPPDDAVKFIRGAFGSEIADNVLIKGAKTAAKNSMVGKALGKAGSRSALKKIPLLGAVLGTAFAIDRARKGDFLGAGLEFSSGMLGLIPGLGSGLGFGIDGFLLARDLGMTPMRDRGSITGGANLPFFVGGRGFTMNEKGSGDERIRVESDDKSRHLDAGLGLIEAMKSKRNDYVKIMGQGVFSGIGDAASGGLFENIGSGLTTITDNIKNMFSNFKDTTGNILNKLNPFKRDENGQNMFQRVGSNVKNWWNKDSSDGGIIDSARFNVQKFINRRILGKKDTKYMQQYNPEEGVAYGSLPSDYKETEAKYFQTGMYTPNVENSDINVAPAVSMGATYITNNNYGVGSGASGGDTGDGNPTIDDLGFQGLVSNFNLASK